MNSSSTLDKKKEDVAKRKHCSPNWGVSVRNGPYHLQRVPYGERAPKSTQNIWINDEKFTKTWRVRPPNGIVSLGKKKKKTVSSCKKCTYSFTLCVCVYNIYIYTAILVPIIILSWAYLGLSWSIINPLWTHGSCHSTIVNPDSLSVLSCIFVCVI